MNRFFSSATVVLVLTLATPNPVSPAVSSAKKGALAGYLLEPPPGYEREPQRKRRQPDAVPLTPHEKALLFAPFHPSLFKRSMGWTARNGVYGASIPAEAREVPEDLSGLPVLRFNNIEVRGERELRWRAHGEYDQWFLHDGSRHIHAVMAIHRSTRRTYLFEYRRLGPTVRLGAGADNCYSCHAGGPRLVRTYRLPKVDRTLLAGFNARMLSYGPGDFGDSVDPTRLGPPLDDARCTGCHNGHARGTLYPIHARTIRYFLKDLRAMPPGKPLSAPEADALLRRLHDRWKQATPAME